MTAAEWLEFDADADTYRMPPEHGFLLASDGSDHYMGGLLIGGPALVSLAPRLSQAFRQGGGIAFDGSQADWIEAMDLYPA